jgi:ABC-2 type transport system ATP-binding protein
MRSDIVRTQNLTKWYGPRPAVADVSFSVTEGEVMGLLGPNGSGKSTILRILTGYIAPSSGTVEVAGHDLATEAFALRHMIGYVPEDAPIYAHMRVREFLRFIARLKGLDGRTAERSIEEVVSQLRLEGVVAVPVGKLSRGFRQRVAIAQALLNVPKLLVLDEPTTGLDPNQVIAVRDLIRTLAGKQTVLVASHVLSEIEQVATRVMILQDGKLLTADALRHEPDSWPLRLRVAGGESEVRACIGAVPGVRAIVTEPHANGGPRRYLIQADQRAGLAEDLAAALFARNFALSELVAAVPSLERAYLDLTRRPREKAPA